MKYFVYEIRNITNNKVYIGITRNDKRREIRHFSELRNNRHHNSKLQRAWNKYGESNFKFKVIESLSCTKKHISELEKKYVETYNSYHNGYNLNLGGYDKNGFESKLNENDVMNILATVKFHDRAGGILSEIYDVSRTTISRINRGMSHENYREKFLNLSLDEQRAIYNEFNKEFKLDLKVAKSNSMTDNRKFTKKDIFDILSINEFDNRKIKQMSDIFNVSDNTISSIVKGVTYKDIYIEYNNLSNNDRFKLYNLALIKYKLKNKNANRRYDKETILCAIYLLEQLYFTPREIINILPINSPSTINRLSNRTIYLDVWEEYLNLSSKEKDKFIFVLIHKYNMLNKKLSSSHKITVNQVFNIIDKLNEGILSQQKIAEIFSIPRGSIPQIKNKEIYKSAINFYEKYKTLNKDATSCRNVC